ncbi:MAG: sigma-70 family RNA polymerase sigma factor [Actinomycetota bacterium]
MEDAELVDRAKRGDVVAYEQLVRRYQDDAIRLATLLTGSRQDAEDAAQEAFVKAYFALDRVRKDTSFRPWILRIAANEAHNRRRWNRSRESVALTGDHPSGDAAPSPEEVVVDRESADAVLALVSGLREQERLVVGCRYLLGLTENETAEVLGIRNGTVKSRLSRALARLREAAEEEGGLA